MPVLRDKERVRVRFLLGPAGTGKTFLCLREIRRALTDDPGGPPLILLSPKQATFQLERQLLGEPDLPGYTRLHILSFERLAKFILDRLGHPPPRLLSEDGRTMVLHALLARRQDDLSIFHSSARLPGFARQLSVELREFQRHRLSPAVLLDLSNRADTAEPLRRKLRDLSLLLGDYMAWLEKNNLKDVDCLLDLATLELLKAGAKAFSIAGLWLDGFGEMTPQELALLAALAPSCQEATLAFCLDRPRKDGDTPWLSIWSGISKSWRRCWDTLSAVPQARLRVEVLPRRPAVNRYAPSPVLAHLEEHWADPTDFPGVALPRSLRVVVCPNPASEAVLAAREIMTFVRAGGRFREAAVLVRRMEGYHDDLRRVFTRYQIPFFLDRRQPVAQHPLAELTRSTLRAAAFGWRHDDWFGALKSGLVADDEHAIDALENVALEHGWKGEDWFAPFHPSEAKLQWADRLRAQWIKPFAAIRSLRLARPSGPQLAEALRALWQALDVEKKLERWTDAVHATVWEQMNAWLDDVKLAFAGESLPWADWLPILEAGLTGLTVGVIPPVMDQVLIGAVDRSRNPELKLVLLLGVNEKVFPALPPADGLLSEADRAELNLGHDTRQFLSREQFFGYIACTRSSERLVVTCAQHDSADQPLNPSGFISRLKSLFSTLEIENFSTPAWSDAQHPSELMGLVAHPASSPATEELLQWPVFNSFREQLKAFRARPERETLSPALAEKLYGPSLTTSVSRLEQFAACSFRFFIHSGLRAEERRFFELEVRERGTFQHEILATFHQQLQSEKKKWRDLTPEEARQRIARIVTETTPRFMHGLIAANAQTRFSVRVLSESLQDFVGAMVQWMSQYQFDPYEVEMGFGTDKPKLPSWRLDLGGGHHLVFRGIIDRIDLCHLDSGDEALAVVIDYKSSARKLDKLMMAHGLQLQLAGYLNVLRRLADPHPVFGTKRLVPAGVFYVNLRGQAERGRSRTEVLQGGPPLLRYQHSGRFDHAALSYLDNRRSADGTQFKYKLNKDGQPHARNTDLMSSDHFSQLLDEVESQLVRMGREIYDGTIELNPFQKGSERACDKCEYQGICRFDTWTHSFRRLATPVVE
jgi:ATP-dependent helicase/nuclease subunit B